MAEQEGMAASDECLTRREFLVAAVALPALATAQMVAPPGVIDLLIIGPDIVTFDDNDTVIMDGAIAVKGNAIAWMGKASDAAQCSWRRTP